jgi:hypothetical protein
MATFVWPTSAEVQEIEQLYLPRLEDGRVGLELFPVVSEDVDEVMWEQMDNFQGLQGVRGLNGEPGAVKKTGAKRYQMRPGYYGEFERIDEEELTRRRKLGTFGQPIDIGDLTTIADRKLMQRELDRIEWIVWTLLTTGTFAVSNSAGILHTDTFPIQTFTASPAWSSTSTATPVADLRTIALNQRGLSTNFGAAATLYVNKVKANQLLSNSNSNDLGKYKQDGNGQQVLVTVSDINKILLAQDLPQIEVYDAGYYDETGTFNTYLPNNKGVLVGPRMSGATVGEYKMTRNANNPDLGPGRYQKVIDRGENEVPRIIEVHRGHNGGPVLYFPGSIVALTI